MRSEAAGFAALWEPLRKLALGLWWPVPRRFWRPAYSLGNSETKVPASNCLLSKEQPASSATGVRGKLMSCWGRADGPSGRLADRPLTLGRPPCCPPSSPASSPAQLPSSSPLPGLGWWTVPHAASSSAVLMMLSVPVPSLGFTLPARLSHHERPSLLAIHGEPPCRATRLHHSRRRGASCTLWGVWRPLNPLEARSAALPIVTTHGVPRHGHSFLGHGVVAESPQGESHCSRSSASEMADGGDSLLRPVTSFLALPGGGGVLRSGPVSAPSLGCPAAGAGHAGPALWWQPLLSEADGPGRRPSHTVMGSSLSSVSSSVVGGGGASPPHKDAMGPLLCQQY